MSELVNERTHEFSERMNWIRELFLFYARGYTKTIITVTGDIITSPFTINMKRIEWL